MHDAKVLAKVLQKMKHPSYVPTLKTKGSMSSLNIDITTLETSKRFRKGRKGKPDLDYSKNLQHIQATLTEPHFGWSSSNREGLRHITRVFEAE